jgi:hypothetical protein
MVLCGAHRARPADKQPPVLRVCTAHGAEHALEQPAALVLLQQVVAMEMGDLCASAARVLLSEAAISIAEGTGLVGAGGRWLEEEAVLC